MLASSWAEKIVIVLGVRAHNLSIIISLQQLFADGASYCWDNSVLFKKLQKVNFFFFFFEQSFQLVPFCIFELVSDPNCLHIQRQKHCRRTSVIQKPYWQSKVSVSLSSIRCNSQDWSVYRNMNRHTSASFLWVSKDPDCLRFRVRCPY